MIQSQLLTATYQLVEPGNGIPGAGEFASPRHSEPRSANLNFPSVLVTSSDETIVHRVADIVAGCGLGIVLAFSVSESRRILGRYDVCLVVCGERFSDGSYEDILHAGKRSGSKTPVIVISPTGDWPDYLKAMTAGAFDYLAYPPIPGDLPRTIHHALAWIKELNSKLSIS